MNEETRDFLLGGGVESILNYKKYVFYKSFFCAKPTLFSTINKNHPNHANAL